MDRLNERTPSQTEAYHLKGKGTRSSTVLLCIHGFTGSPAEFHRAAAYWHAIGYSVCALRLPGHGTCPEDMLRTGWRHWWAHTLAEFDRLSSSYKTVVPVGHSMGGLLALLLGAARPVDGVVSLAAPVYLTSRKTAWAFLLRYFLTYVERRPTVSEELAAEAQAYRKIPVPCVSSLRKLMQRTKTRVSRITAPSLIMQGELDRVVRPISAAYLFRRIGSSRKQLAYYAHSSHAILLDAEKEQVFSQIASFAEEISSKTGPPRFIQGEIVYTKEQYCNHAALSAEEPLNPDRPVGR